MKKLFVEKNGTPTPPDQEMFTLGQVLAKLGAMVQEQLNAWQLGRVFANSCLGCLTTVVNYVQKRGWRTTLEPRIITSQGLRKPDLSVPNGGRAFIADCTVCTDLIEQGSCRERSDCSEIKEWK